jgi:hypothetical protein
MFVGPVMMVPFIVFSAYGFGEGYASIPILIRIMMRFSYLRYSFEALVLVMLSGRKLDCPETEEFCIFTDLDKFIEIMAMSNGILLGRHFGLSSIFGGRQECQLLFIETTAYAQ